MVSFKRFMNLFCLVFLQVMLLSQLATGTSHQISIIDFAFIPQNDTIAVGDSVRWTNDGSFDHTSTSNTGVCNSPVLVSGHSFAFAFNVSPGSYPYHCSVHPSLMTGTIVVLASDVKDQTGSREEPSEFTLSQNYPNPFNLSTQIDFTLTHSGFVSLNIYDILGRKVKTLVSENLSSGYKSVLWDGRSDSGENISSGVYFYRLKVISSLSNETGDFSETRKLLLLK